MTQIKYRINDLRRENGYSQEELAELIGSK